MDEEEFEFEYEPEEQESFEWALHDPDAEPHEAESDELYYEEHPDELDLSGDWEP